MNTTELKSLRTRLLAEEHYLTGEIEGEMAEQEMIAATAGEERLSSADDASSEIFEREKMLAVEEAFEEMLAEARHALHKMDAGNYGVCDDCGQPIAAERLNVRPQASLCVQCKSRLERAHRGLRRALARSGA